MVDVVMTANDRPEYFKEALLSWQQVRGLENLSISLEPNPVQERMIEAVDTLGDSRLNIELNESKLGVRINPLVALSLSFQAGSPFTVLAEDDIIVSTDTLEYFKWTSEEFKEDEEVMGVCAFTQEQGPENETVKKSVFSPLVWGTWKDRWDSHISNSWMAETGPGQGVEVGWDWEMGRLLQRNRAKFIFPRSSRSNHIGRYGGTHMVESLFHTAWSESFVLNRNSVQYTLGE